MLALVVLDTGYNFYFFLGDKFFLVSGGTHK